MLPTRSIVRAERGGQTIKIDARKHSDYVLTYFVTEYYHQGGSLRSRKSVLGDRSYDGLRLRAPDGRAHARRRAERFSIRFYRGLVVGIVASALLWAGTIAVALRLL